MTPRLRTLLPLAAVLLALGLAGGCQGGDTDAERQILQQLAAIQDDLDELKGQVSDLKEQVAARPTAAAPAAAPVPRFSPNPVQTAGFPSLGKNDAPITMVEFTDFQCPFCRRHAANTLPQIRKNFVDTGKVRYVVVDNPIPSHRYAAQAAQAAHCAGDQGKYWQMHDHLFENQHRITPQSLPVLAKEVGVDEKAFSACMDSGKHVDEVQAAVRVSAMSGARGTPSFVIGKTQPDGKVSGQIVVGAKAYNYFAGILDKLLGS
jgi:protein-disulfide isomerase